VDVTRVAIGCARTQGEAKVRRLALVAKHGLAIGRFRNGRRRRGLETERPCLRHEPVHPELARDGQRAREQRSGLRASCARIAIEKQAGMGELGPREEGTRADALMDRRRVLEVPRRVRDPAER
jgi:hypothetical protein